MSKQKNFNITLKTESKKKAKWFIILSIRVSGMLNPSIEICS